MSRLITKEETETAIWELSEMIALIKQNNKDWLDDRDIPILETAIQALKNQQAAQEMLEEEKKKYRFEWKRPDRSRGRISAFYDALRVDYSD